MFDKLEDILIRYEEIQEELNSPEVTNDQNRYRKLMKEYSSLTPLVEKYQEYKDAKQTIEDSLAMMEEPDEELKELAKEELAAGKETLAACEQQLKILLLPKDPNDDKNVIVEIRAGAGGDDERYAAE